MSDYDAGYDKRILFGERVDFKHNIEYEYRSSHQWYTSIEMSDYDELKCSSVKV